jgi:hypothetical protein
MTHVAQPVQAPGIFDIEVPGNWVLPDDQFWLAIVKPPYHGTEPILNDASRPDALALARALFSPNANGQYPITLNSPDRSAIVLFPEFAFGSRDFGALDQLIRPQTRPTIVFAGFGAVTGDNLVNAINGGQALCGWHSGVGGVDTTKRYNAAWCWIHDPSQEGENAHRCFILLKNWPEQRIERIEIPNIAGGTDTVRLVTDDCIIFPLICADILHSAPDCPQERIAASIRAGRLDRKQVLIPLLMLDSTPSHPSWRTRLSHLIQAEPLKVAIIASNHAQATPLIPEEDDRIRCLSGALVSNQQFSPDHREVPHPVRPVIHTGFAGYVLRSGAPGFAAGDFTWREVGLVNRFIWLPNVRVTMEANGMNTAIAAPVQVEMQRWCRRVRPPAWLGANSPGKAFLDRGLGRTQTALASVTRAESLLPGAINGRGLDPQIVCDLDKIGSIPVMREALDDAFIIAASVGQVPGYVFEPGAHAGHFHRTATGNRGGRDIIIWSSPDRLSGYQFHAVQEAALDGRFSEVAVVVARGAGGTPPSFSRVSPDATTDIGTPPPSNDPNDIAEVPPMSVFWMPFGEIQQMLAREDWERLPAENRQGAISAELERLLNRISP